MLHNLSQTTVYPPFFFREGHRNLASVKSISDTSAALLLSAIGDVQGFESEAMLVSYLGIALQRSLSPLVKTVENLHLKQRAERVQDSDECWW